MMRDSLVYRYLPPQLHRVKGAVLVRRWLLREKAGSAFCLIAHRRVSDDCLGIATYLNENRVDRSAEIGYALRRREWGKGFGTEIAGALVDWGFQQRKLHRLGAVTDVRNSASIRILHRLGFRQEGVSREAIRAGRSYVDLAHFGILRDEARHAQYRTRT
jgi:RimJ/RimL family protein N-acetyltransferase